jgi:hypothetical protein
MELKQKFLFPDDQYKYSACVLQGITSACRVAVAQPFEKDHSM